MVPKRKRSPSDLDRFRKEVWQHNAFLGHVALAKKNLAYIGICHTVTAEAQAKAIHIVKLLDELEPLLHTRVDRVEGSR